MGDREKMIALAVTAEERARYADRKFHEYRRTKQVALANEMKGRAAAFEAMSVSLRLALDLTPADLRVEARVLGLIDTDLSAEVEWERRGMAIRGRYPIVTALPSRGPSR